MKCRWLWLLAGMTVSLAEEAPRKWTNTAGQSFEGTFVSASADKITIRRADGKVFEVERAKLSADDLAYADKASKGAAAGPAGAAPQVFDDYLARMLAGYTGGNPNFDAPWPKDAGITEEPKIQTIDERPDEKIFIYESDHFRFQSNVVLRPSLIAKVAAMFEASYQTHLAIPLNNRRTRSPKAAKLRAFLYETKEQYFAAGGPTGSAGVYMGRDDKFMVPLEKLGVQKVGSGYMFDYKGDFSTVYHEITHLLWADIGPMAGIWMTEGFAEYIACAPYSNGRFSFIKQPSYALEYATGYGKKDGGGRALGDEFSMPRLEEILNWSQAKFYEDGNRNYGFGLLLVYYFILMDGDGTGANFKACIKACQEGKKPSEALAVLMAGRSYEELEKAISAAFKRKGIRISFG
jgi:hypothetical protein